VNAVFEKEIALITRVLGRKSVIWSEIHLVD